MKEVRSYLLDWLLTIAVVVFGYYLGGLVTATGLMMVALGVIILNVILDIFKCGRALLTSLLLSAWFLMSFSLGWAMSFF